MRLYDYLQLLLLFAFTSVLVLFLVPQGHTAARFYLYFQLLKLLFIRQQH